MRLDTKTAHPFEELLSVGSECLEELLQAPPLLPWVEFWMNPRRLRGSDFLMRWTQGVWSEQRLIEAVGETKAYFALPYGPSGTAPADDARAFELYFERLEAAGLGQVKRPDLLVFPVSAKPVVELQISKIGGLAEMPFISEDDPRLQAILQRAILAVECENSLWRAAKMPDYHAPLKPQRRLGGHPGLRKNAVLPTVIIKEEDRQPLADWQARQGIPIHIWHVFFDLAFGLDFEVAEQLVREGQTEPTAQTFQAPGGATTRKIIYKHYYHWAYPLGNSREEPQLRPAFIEDKNGHILPYVTFSGGALTLSKEALSELAKAEQRRISSH